MAEIATREQIEQRMVERAVADDGFRAELIADPRAAIAKELGVDPGGLTEIEVLEETPEKIFLVLPVHDGAISDEELGAVAGGFCAPAPWLHCGQGHPGP